MPSSVTGGMDLVRLPALNVAIEHNVRTTADLHPTVLASVKRHGVLLPTFGYRDEKGRVVVCDGQMRVLAAIEASCDVPVYLTSREDSTAKRIAEQLVANERRTALTEGDRLAAYRQLECEGLSATAIAKETGAKRDTVKRSLTVANSETAAVAGLQGVVDDGYAEDLPLVAERLRQDRRRKATSAALAAEWTETGIRVVSHDHDEYEYLSSLTDDNESDSECPGIDANTHAAACAGHAVLIRPWGSHEAVGVCTAPGSTTPLRLPQSSQPRDGGCLAECGGRRRGEGGREG